LRKNTKKKDVEGKKKGWGRGKCLRTPKRGEVSCKGGGAAPEEEGTGGRKVWRGQEKRVKNLWRSAGLGIGKRRLTKEQGGVELCGPERSGFTGEKEKRGGRIDENC